MCRKLANWLRRLAEWLAPQHPQVEALMPLVRERIAAAETLAHSGSIKWLLVMKEVERKTGAKRRHINAAIDLAVLERHGD
jgi:hypothetical protein